MGNTVTLHSACEYGDLVEVHRLLKTATAEELEATDDSGRTPLLLAVASLKHLRVQDELDDDFDDLHGFVEDEDDAIEGRGEEQTGSTEEQDPAAPGSCSSSEAEELVNEVKDDTDLELLPKEAEILHLLLQRRVNIDHRDENGWTALHHGCFVQNAVAIKMLIHAGARPMRESFGLLPQDLLQRGHMSEWVTQAQELKETLDQITDKSAYSIKLLAFRPSGIVQLDMGGQVEKGSFVTLEYDVPETHSVKDYIQVLISQEDSAEIETGSYHHVPAGAHGQLTISTKDLAPASTVRFVYVKSDINTMSREVVASGCNAVVQASVGEIFQYELFLYERVVEVESIPEFEFIDQPLIVLKRIGIVDGEEIDWVTIRPDNHIVAVNDIRIDAMEFSEAVHVLQENNGRQCTKLLMQNYSACGDFIPEKILGVGVVGKYAYLHPVDDEENHLKSVEQTYEEWINNSNSGGNGEVGEEVVLGPVSTFSSTIQTTTETTTEHQLPTPPTETTEMLLPPPLPAEVALPSSIPMERADRPSPPPSPTPPAEERHVANKVADNDYDPATMDREEKISASSTIETVVPLHNSLQLVAQLQHGISIGHANR